MFLCCNVLLTMLLQQENEKKEKSDLEDFRIRSIDDVRIFKKIGKRKFGATEKQTVVCRLQSSDLEYVAHIYSKEQQEMFEKELRVLSKIDHFYILKLEGFFENVEKKMVLTQYCTNGDLRSFHKIHKNFFFKDNRKFQILQQITQGLDYLHEQIGIFHLDIKSNNILLDHCLNAKISDFDKCHECEDKNEKVILDKRGTSAYMSPEMSLGKEITKKTDVFSLGIVFNEIMTNNYTPYLDYLNSESDIMIDIEFGIEEKVASDPNLRPTIPKEFYKRNKKLFDLIRRMWDHNPSNRPDLQEIERTVNELIIESKHIKKE